MILRRESLAHVAVLATMVLALSACMTAVEPEIEPPENIGLFQRYAALGGSTAAGVRSGGLTAAMQREAYPALLAARAGANFVVPAVAAPGCPPPMSAPRERAAAAPLPCTIAAPEPASERGRNLAVPTTTVEQVAARTAPADVPLHAILVGDGAVLDLVDAIDPTFVTFHLGEDEVLAVALSGVGISAAPPSPGDGSLPTVVTFAANYGAVVDAVAASHALEGAILIGIRDPVAWVPLLQPGAFFFAARDAQGRFEGKLVNSNCSPITNLGQVNPLARNLISFEMVGDDAFAEISCDPNTYPSGDARRGRYLIDVQERVIVSDRVAELNAVIAQVASDRGWGFIDPNVAFAAVRDAVGGDGRYLAVRMCQLLATATTPIQIQAAVLTSCPVSGPTAATNSFGSLVSFDGVHPSAQYQMLLTDALASLAGALYGAEILPANVGAGTGGPGH